MIPLHQNDAVLALYLLVLDKRMGGLLLRGPSGTGKSLIVGKAAEMIPCTRIPMGTDQGALLGTVDMEKLLLKGEIFRREGPLHGGNCRLLIVEHLNLFPDELQDLILSSGSSVLATISGSEDIRGKLLDRFGMCVNMAPLLESEERLSVLKSIFLPPLPLIPW